MRSPCTFLLIWNSVSIIYCSGPFEGLSQYTKHYVVYKKVNTLRYNNISFNANIMVLPT
ncbi:unknown [Bacteroides sp. CAG:709]|nr:unknown [Bacteroides sp. CAG:709]